MSTPGTSEAVPATGRSATATSRLLALLSVLLTAALTVVLLPSPAQAGAGSDFASRINAERTSRGGKALVVRSDLTAAAQAQAERMADRSRLFHNPDLGGSVGHWVLLGENVGYGPDVATIHRAFMNSAPHRANILNSRYTEIGIGVVVRDDVMWVAEVFRRPTDAGASGSGSSAGTHSTTGKASSTTGPDRTGTDSGPATASTTQTRHTKAAAQPHRRAAGPRPPGHAVGLAAAAEAALPGVRIAGSIQTAAPPHPGTELTQDPASDSSSSALIAIGLLAAVTVGAAVRFRLV